jgi:hypothetical protein
MLRAETATCRRDAFELRTGVFRSKGTQQMHTQIKIKPDHHPEPSFAQIAATPCVIGIRTPNKIASLLFP